MVVSATLQGRECVCVSEVSGVSSHKDLNTFRSESFLIHPFLSPWQPLACFLSLDFTYSE